MAKTIASGCDPKVTFRKLVEEKELLDPDTSGIDLAPEGSELLEPEYKKVDDATAPDTEHLSLES